MKAKDLLIEVRTEELPPKNLKALRDSFANSITKGLARENLDHSRVLGYATPRRLAIIVEQLASSQADQLVERRGPALAAALDEAGEPRKALLGFAKSCGITNIEELEQRTTEKGTWFYFTENKPGKDVAALMPQIIDQAIKALPIERKMRWGSSRAEFVRPVQSFILMYGDTVIPATLLEHHSGNHTMGHRFMSEGEIAVENAGSYVESLREHHVIVDFEERVESIRAQISAIARSLKSEVVIDEALLEEVASLVEWPFALTGNFDKSFLQVPEEALISAMKEHQRYFHLVDQHGKLLPRFITVSNIESKDPDAVIAGNERVIAPRLSDAAFFFAQDRKSSLESKLPRLGEVVFQNELGTYKSKVERISKLAAIVARMIDADVETAARAGLLCKSDLVSDMVNEFPDLQGLMGGYYATHDGESNDVSKAITEHYLPIQSGGKLPESATGWCVSIADKLDTLTGLFGIGQPPTGSKDPYALRRQTLGVIRICIENNLKLDIKSLLNEAASLHEKDFDVDPVYLYFLDRLEVWYQEQGISGYLFNALRYSHSGICLLSENHAQLKALQEFTSNPEAEGLIGANKRVANILKKADSNDITDVDSSLFETAIEDQLYAGITQTTGKMEVTINFADKLNLLGKLQPIIAQYFEEVLVNCEDLAIRKNRLATLRALRLLFLGTADFSLLQQ